MLLERLLQKPTPFCFLESHAGAGRYLLHSDESQKKREYEKGILRLFKARDNTAPIGVLQYLNRVLEYNPDEQLKVYPGSPAIAAHFMRSQDQMILCELHPEAKELLYNNIRTRHSKIAVHHLDGYLGMKAFLPPKEARGLVLIDPPFEVTDEFSRILTALKGALTHWRGGQYLIWYPIKNERAVNTFEQSLQHVTSESLFIHMTLNDAVEPGKLKSCGLALINPPWKLKEELEEHVAPYLSYVLDATISVTSR